ncbi:MAG TPA: hypothetical protein VLS89_03735 [Candidatus Nanopelagicales bacterium]|nr:hypothetical protein [Candidatus Nanopelagicales bacterium]
MRMLRFSVSGVRSRLVALVMVAGAGGAAVLAACVGGAPLGDGPAGAESTDPTGPGEAAIALEELASPGGYGFATRELVLVDETRPTPPNRGYPGSPVRTLPTRIYYPALPYTLAASPPPEDPVPVAPGGPFPIVAYAHGFTSRGEPGRFMGEHLASHGYIVVAPLFPLTRGDAPGGPTMAVAQAPVSCFLGAPVFPRSLPTLRGRRDAAVFLTVILDKLPDVEVQVKL